MQIQAHIRLEAKDAKQAGIALNYFQKIFGKYKGKQAFDPNNDLGEDYTGSVSFKDKKTRDCELIGIELTLDPEGLMFTCDFIYWENGEAVNDTISVSASTADVLISKFKKEIERAIKRQEQNLASIKNVISFLKSSM